jgi:hypothetical protein
MQTGEAMARNRTINEISISSAAISAGVEALERAFPSQFEFAPPIGVEEDAAMVFAAMLAADRQSQLDAAPATRKSHTPPVFEGRVGGPSKRASGRVGTHAVLPSAQTG